MTDSLERRVTFNDIRGEEAGKTRMALLNPSCNVDLLVRDPRYHIQLLDMDINHNLWQLVPFEENGLRRGWMWELWIHALVQLWLSA